MKVDLIIKLMHKPWTCRLGSLKTFQAYKFVRIGLFSYGAELKRALTQVEFE